jgi:myo-inositol-1(or 4)-monophosphatase
VIVDGKGRPDPLPPGAMVVAVPDALDAVLSWWRAAEG